MDWSSIIAQTWHPGLGYGLLLVLPIAGLLLHYRPGSRKNLVGTLIIYLTGLSVLSLSGLLRATEFPGAADTLREIGVLLEGMALIRLGGMLVFRLLLPQLHLQPPRILEELAVIAGYLFYAMLRLRFAGLELSDIVTTSAVITAVAAFSMQETLGNVLGGVALQLDNSLKVGDWIKLDTISGQVVDIRWRSTSIETRNWETVVIPNSQLMREKFLVLGRRQGRPEQWRRWVWFNVDYDTPPGRVIEAVEQSVRAAEIQNVAKEPVPTCVLMDFDTLSGRYALRYWLTDPAVDDSTDSTVRLHVFTALKRAGISPFVPEWYVDIAEENDRQAETRRQDDLRRRMELLRQIDLFQPLTEDELDLVARRLKHTPFAKGAHMTEQGAVAHWLYIVTDGRAEVLVGEGPGRRHLGTIDASQGPSFFGEMGLMTGEPRSATVIAQSDLECFRLDKRSFEDILHSRPELAETLSRIIARRRAELDSARSEIAARSRESSLEHRQTELLRRIQAFFNLT